MKYTHGGCVYVDSIAITASCGGSPTVHLRCLALCIFGYGVEATRKIAMVNIIFYSRLWGIFSPCPTRLGQCLIYLSFLQEACRSPRGCCSTFSPKETRNVLSQWNSHGKSRKCCTWTSRVPSSPLRVITAPWEYLQWTCHLFLFIGFLSSRKYSSPAIVSQLCGPPICGVAKDKPGYCAKFSQDRYYTSQTL